MRFIVVMVGIVLLLFGGTYWVLFTESGNKMLIPYIESKVSEAAGAPIQISTFRLTPSSLALDAIYQESVHVRTEGTLSLLAKSFDLDYVIEADSLKTPQINIDEPISLKGNAKGDLKDINIKGIGVLFEAPASYDVRLLDGALARAVAMVENLSIQKLLGLANQPILAYGRGDLQVNITESSGSPAGTAKIQVHDGSLDEKVILDQYGVELPQNVTFQANFDAHMQGDEVKAKGVVDSSLARLLISDGVVQTNSQAWQGDFELFAPSLKALEGLAGMPLQGKIVISGQAQGDTKGVQARVKTESLGGKIEGIYKGDKVFVTGENVALEKILYTLVQPPLARGGLNLEAQMDSIANKKGTVVLNIPKGELLGAGMEELTGMNWPKVSGFEFKSNALLNKESVEYDANLESSLASVRDIKGTLDTATMSTQTPFSLHVEKLSNLAFITGRALQGPMQMSGIIKLTDGIPFLQANTEVLGGQSVITFENSVALVEASDFSMERLSEVADFPYVFEATGKANVKYDAVKKQGDFSLLLPKGHLRQSELVNLVRTFTGFDLVKETYTDSTLKGVIKDQMVGFDVAMQGEESFIKIDQGILDLDAQSINAPFALKVQNKDLSGAIKGKMSEPKISIKTSDYIQKKIGKELEKHLPEGAGGAVKELLKLF